VKLYRETWMQSPGLFLRSMLIPIVLIAAALVLAVMGHWDASGACIFALLAIVLVREAIFRLLSRNRKALK
jgi:hypothetical protein